MKINLYLMGQRSGEIEVAEDSIIAQACRDTLPGVIGNALSMQVVRDLTIVQMFRTFVITTEGES